MKTAYAYTKTCVGEPSGGEVVSQQLEAIYRYAQDQGIKIVGEYSDISVYPKNEIRHRDGLYEMVDDAARNDVICVIVAKSEEIARDNVVRVVLLAILADHDLCVLSALDGTNLMASSSALLSLARRTYRAYMDSRRVILPLQLRMARSRVRRERGRCEGSKPFGHYPGEQETLKRMLQLSRKPRGKPKRSYQAIADILNDEGRPTRLGGPWWKATVHRLIQLHKKQDSPTRSPY